jgi:23S rRNA pseudouridine955/2504/2580 synthase/23S rRNA pseudouridine1911/1915/1917 synthase
VTLPGVILKLGDTLRYDVSDIPEPPVDPTFRVVSDDPQVLVVDKSGNLPCHPGGRYFNHTLWALLKAQYGLVDPVLVNRIDRETSGLVIIGKTPEASQSLWKQFVAHRVVKRYTVFVEGVFPERLEAAGWLTADPVSAIRKKRRFVAGAPGSAPKEKGDEWAETLFDRVRLCDGFSVVTASPRTGRLHQIRATLLSLGYPVVGDKLYGVDETLFLRFCDDALTEADRLRLRMRRQALHADYLRFYHPRFGALTELSVPLPPDMEGLIQEA